VEDLQAAAHDLFDQLIVWVDVQRPLEASRPLREFANAVRAARDAQPGGCRC
jgi:hypothetical protein